MNTDEKIDELRQCLHWFNKNALPPSKDRGVSVFSESYSGNTFSVRSRGTYKELEALDAAAEFYITEIDPNMPFVRV